MRHVFTVLIRIRGGGGMCACVCVCLNGGEASRVASGVEVLGLLARGPGVLGNSHTQQEGRGTGQVETKAAVLTGTRQ